VDTAYYFLSKRRRRIRKKKEKMKKIREKINWGATRTYIRNEGKEKEEKNKEYGHRGNAT
jgi:hypothetical protein